MLPQASGPQPREQQGRPDAQPTPEYAQPVQRLPEDEQSPVLPEACSQSPERLLEVPQCSRPDAATAQSSVVLAEAQVVQACWPPLQPSAR